MSLPKVLSERIRLPVMAAPLFIISSPDLVIAQCRAGIVGSFPALNARPASALETWLDRIKAELAVHDATFPLRPSAPFAVNQIVHRSNDRLERDIDVCVRYKVPIVITSLGARQEINDAIHSYGGIVLHDVVDDRFARKAIERGADGLIAVAAGAGGHAGTQSPFALVQEIREWFDGPLLLSGSISSGRSILAAMAMGADMAYIGSAFIATREANAVPAYKQMIVECRASDIIYTNLVAGVHANYLQPSLVAAGFDAGNSCAGKTSGLDFSTDQSKPKAWKDVWGCGQGIGPIRQVTGAGDFIDRLAQEFHAAQREIAQRVALGS